MRRGSAQNERGKQRLFRKIRSSSAAGMDARDDIACSDGFPAFHKMIEAHCEIHGILGTSATGAEF
jgi:hypothetical protein